MCFNYVQQRWPVLVGHWVGSGYIRLGAATTELIDMVMRVYHMLTWL